MTEGDDVTAEEEPDDGIDMTLVPWMLSLTPSERLDVLQSEARALAEALEDGSDA